MTNTSYREKLEPEREFDPGLLKAAIRFNTGVMGLVSGLTAALVLFGATHVSLSYWGPDAGGYLGLLGVFFPGYEVSSMGAWIGALWSFVFAGLGGALTYGCYARLLGEDLAASATQVQDDSNPITRPATLRLRGVPLGLALGAALGAALFLSTSVLILRGTADSSVHASLLSNYLPGYSVTYLGALLGALELFGFVLACSVVLACIYNKLVALRNPEAS